MSFTADPTLTGQYLTGQNNAAQIAYYQAKLQGDSDQLAFAKAQAAVAMAGNLSNTFGYAPGGDWFTWGPGGPTIPPAGTPTQSAIAGWQNLANQQLGNQLSIAGATGYFAQPRPSQYTPGTILTAPSQTGGGNAYGIVNSDGSVQMVTTEALAQTAAQRGTTADALISRAQPVDWGTLQQLSMGPPTGPATPTLDLQRMQQQNAYNAGQLTGMYSDPTQTVQAFNARGQAMNGQTFDSLPPDQQQFWLQYNQNDRTQAATAWASGVNQALSANGFQTPNQNAPTLQMQALYGQYGAPTAGQQTLAGQEQSFTQNLRTEQEQRAAQAQQQQQAMGYLQLLSNLRGPADWAKYQQVLGSTPGGMRDLVAAAAGQYVPGGGATTGVQPQAVSLQSMMGDVSGNPYTGQGGGQLNMPSVYQGGQGSYGMQTGQYQYQPQAGQTQQWANPSGGQINTAQMWSGPKSGAAWDQYTQQQQAQNQAAAGQLQTQGGYGTGMGYFGTAQPAQMFSGQTQTAGGQQQFDVMPSQYSQQRYAYGQTPSGGSNDSQAIMGALVAPNQMASQTWNNLTPSQQQMLLGTWESKGYTQDDAKALFNQSLPKYGASPTSGTYRLQ